MKKTSLCLCALSLATKPRHHLHALAALFCLLSVALVVPTAASADDYQYIISGDPEYDPPASFLASGGTSLTGGPLSNRSASDALDARYRTDMASIGTGLRSDKYSGFSIIIR